MLGCKDLRNHQPRGGSIWGHIMRACRGKVISKETRKTLLCSAPHSQACFLLLSPPQAPFLTSGVCPTPSCCPPACRCQDTTVSLSFQGFKPVMSPVNCHVSGTLSGCLPFLRAQALLLAGRTCLPGLPWGSRQRLDRKAAHRCQPIMEVWLPPLQPHLFLLHLFLSPPPSPNALVVLPPYRRLPTALLWSPSTQFSPESQKPFRRGVVNLDIYPVTLEPQCHQNHTEDLLKTNCWALP